VTERIAIIGRMTDMGKPTAKVKVLYVNWSLGAKAMTAPVATSDAMPMLASNQKPALVFSDLRSSTTTMRDSGIGAGAVVRGRRMTVRAACGGAMVFMLLPFLVEFLR
jgi:hypothetical protein